MPNDYLYYSFISDIPSEFKDSYSNSITSKLGLNQNVFKQLLNYYYNILPFPKKVCVNQYLENGVLACSKYENKIIDFGYSYVYMKNVRVWEIIKSKSSISFLIGILAYSLQCLIGYPLGIYIAKSKNKLIERSANSLYLLLSSIPVIMYAYLSMILFMLVFNLPISFDKNNLATYIAPIVTLSVAGSLAIAYWVKKYVTTETNKDYVKLAISKGIDDTTIFYKHILRNSLTPLIRTIPTSLVLCLTGFYIIEAAFNIPGIGLTLITSINLQDIYLVQGLIIYFSLLNVFAYFIGDILTILIDRKCYLSKEKQSHE